MNGKRMNKAENFDFNVETIILLLWNKKWLIIIITLLFVGFGVIVFKVTKKPQHYKYSTEFVLQYQLEGKGHQDKWIVCERIPWKMVRIDYSKAISDSIFLKELVTAGVLESSVISLPVIINSFDSLHINLSVVTSEDGVFATKLLQKIQELFPGYVIELQKDQLELESCLLDRKKEQILLTLTEKSKYLQDLLNRKNVTIIDRMEIARLENECQMLYNSSLNLMSQIADLQLFQKDSNLLMLKPDRITKELVPGGLFSHLSVLGLLFAFIGFMVAVNVILLKAYLHAGHK